jgi:biopolymer transport protein ExbD
MGISMGKTGRSELSEINITPMIDVLLVLLVIFMIAQQVLMKSVDIQLPKDLPPNEQQQQQDKDNIVLEMEPGVIKVNTKPVPKPQLASYLTQIYTGRPKKVIFVKADGRVLYQDVIWAIDVARGAGVKVVGAVLPTAGTTT